jgi:PadR family transcriptional regulator, regulatory protein PadR
LLQETVGRAGTSPVSPRYSSRNVFLVKTARHGSPLIGIILSPCTCRAVIRQNAKRNHFPCLPRGTHATLPLESQGSMDKAQLELVRGTLDVLILKALAWGALHGYAITDLIRRQTDDALLVEEGTLYPALWRLENKGLIEGEWGLSENNRKAKFYKLTTKGRHQLREETRTWEAYATAVTKLLSATKPPVPETE